MSAKAIDFIPASFQQLLGVSDTDSNAQVERTLANLSQSHSDDVALQVATETFFNLIEREQLSANGALARLENLSPALAGHLQRAERTLAQFHPVPGLANHLKSSFSLHNILLR